MGIAKADQAGGQSLRGDARVHRTRATRRRDHVQARPGRAGGDREHPDAGEGAAGSSPRPAGAARTLFRVPFRSAMHDEDANPLRKALDMAVHLHPKHPAVVPPLGSVPLSLDTGLYLVHGEGEAEWALECRSWGDPPAEVVRLWLGQAILAARRLDRSVRFPTREAPG
jgi:hypothetical protein